MRQFGGPRTEPDRDKLKVGTRGGACWTTMAQSREKRGTTGGARMEAAGTSAEPGLCQDATSRDNKWDSSGTSVEPSRGEIGTRGGAGWYAAGTGVEQRFEPG